MEKQIIKTSPWGKVEGVGPTRFARSLIEDGLDPDYLVEKLEFDYGVRHDKAILVHKVLNNQKSIIRNDNLIDLYINIPICPTRCKYCSFISAEIGKVKEQLPSYLACLVKEIREVKKIINEKPYIIRCVYIGGGTPTVLNPMELETLLQEVAFLGKEFTVECGRADTINYEKLAVLKKYGVNRISINPQTFSAKSLKAIGRKHTVQDVIKAYAMALEFGFIVNMDIIAGLEGETFRTFKNSLETLMELQPDNVTVHTLSIKKGSMLAEEEMLGCALCGDEDAELVDQMLTYAYERLETEGYKPYYMYRQKRQIGGMENVGFAKLGKECVYNIDSMEETCSIAACGAHAISKRVNFTEKKITRQANVKFLKDYVERIDKLIEDKKKLFK